MTHSTSPSTPNTPVRLGQHAHSTSSRPPAQSTASHIRWWLGAAAPPGSIARWVTSTLDSLTAHTASDPSAALVNTRPLQPAGAALTRGHQAMEWGAVVWAVMQLSSTSVDQSTRPRQPEAVRATTCTEILYKHTVQKHFINILYKHTVQTAA